MCWTSVARRQTGVARRRTNVARRQTSVARRQESVARKQESVARTHEIVARRQNIDCCSFQEPYSLPMGRDTSKYLIISYLHYFNSRWYVRWLTSFWALSSPKISLSRNEALYIGIGMEIILFRQGLLNLPFINSSPVTHCYTATPIHMVYSYNSRTMYDVLYQN